ncbi:5'-AMP-activated protein kinase subunit gamma-3 [Gopherus evgoodei]|uniref:5'-AMP-activated protein kinase subunit gamma-3 n=1 Tax=Gopherus evgoodei TaxID=1825980 RepID=UPI0011CFE97F|nr:5'-AMP-activated protein kinase subunit gamma-3 [Gopherus evgoodei]
MIRGTGRQVVGLYSRFDVIHLAAQKTYNNLDMSVGEALRRRTLCLEGVLTCHPHETMGDVIDRIVQEQVHRLVLVDEKNSLRGIVSLSDILQALVLSPAVPFQCPTSSQTHMADVMIPENLTSSYKRKGSSNPKGSATYPGISRHSC